MERNDFLGIYCTMMAVILTVFGVLEGNSYELLAGAIFAFAASNIRR